MKRTACILSALILSVFVLSTGVSALDDPLGSLLPDNVTGYGTTMPTIPSESTLTSPNTTLPSIPSDLSTTSSSHSKTSQTSTTQSDSTTSASETTTNQLTNYALASNGASYTIVRLSADKSAEEAISGYFGGTDDNGNKRLNDGIYGEIESASKSVAVGGTGRTFRYKFDLGTKRDGIKKIVFKNIQDSYSADPLNNRSFDESKFEIRSGDSESQMKNVPFNLTKKQIGENSFSYDVTLDLKDGVDGRYFYLDAGPVENAFVLSIDEIQIFGETSNETTTSETELRTPATGDDNTSAYAFIVLIASVVVAAVIFYRRRKTI